MELSSGIPPCIDSLTLMDTDWPGCFALLPEGVLALIAKHLSPDCLGRARQVCRQWRQVFSLMVTSTRLEVKENQAHGARAFLQTYLAAFPSTNELILELSFRRTARERIQVALEAHLQALSNSCIQALHLNLDLNSFNERKIKLPDLSLLGSWSKLTRLTVQESGWRSQQLRVDAAAVFGAVPSLQELIIACKYSNTVKARWCRPLGSLCCTVPATTATPDARGNGSTPSRLPPQPSPQQLPVITQHLRCQLTQNQSMQSELQKALRRIKEQLYPCINALTFEIVEETYVEPSVASGPLELSSLPGLKSLTLLSGAEDALADSALELVGAPGLETLVIYDITCGRWCFNKPGHGIPPRLLAAPPACLRSLTVVGFVINQCKNLHALSLLGSLEELRLEQPDAESVASVVGELLLTQLPRSLRVLKLHGMVLPVCGAMADQLGAHGWGAGGPGPAPPPCVAGPAGLRQHPQQVALAQGGFAPPYFSGMAGAPLPAYAHAAAAQPAGVSAAGMQPPGRLEALQQALCGVSPAAPLPHLRELYLSRCKVPSFGVFGVCPHLSTLGVMNCHSSSGLVPAAAAFPALSTLIVTHTINVDQEQAGSVGPPSPMGGAGPGAIGPGMPAPAPMGGAGGQYGFGLPLPGSGGMLPVMQLPGLPTPPVVWGSDEQVAAVAACRHLTSLQLIVPRGTCGLPSVEVLSRMRHLQELDLALPCVLGECMLGLKALQQLARLTLWVDSRTCINRQRARQLQAIQRNLQAYMPLTLVEWAGADARFSSWTGVEGRVFCAF